MKLVEVRGKSTRGLRRVFVLVDNQSQRAIDAVIENRPFASDFIFARYVSQTETKEKLVIFS
jgi:serine kinase of HPr protein (carbohydrate metabolism regulator)